MTVEIATNAGLIHQFAAVNVGPEPGEDPETGLCRYEITATEIGPAGRRCIPWTGEVLHHRSHGALALTAAIIASLAAEVTT